MEQKTAFKLVKDELERAGKEHNTFNSCHEGYSVILEELDELWVEIKKNNGDTHRGVSEAVQVAAMALRYLADLCDEPVAKQHERKVFQHYTDYDYHGGYSG